MPSSISPEVYEAHQVPAHRKNFGLLLAENPNYFGNLPGSGLPVQNLLQEDVHFEELTCVSYDPARQVLEATIQIKQPVGYDGGQGLCSAGTWEYVRFWLDYGSGWVDAGLTAVNVHDLPAGKDCAGVNHFPVSYVATLPIEPETAWCQEPVLPKVRAILSWQTEPPAVASPALPVPADWPPVFGNHLDAHIQIAPRPPFVIDFLKALQVQNIVLPPVMEAGLHVPVPLPDPAPLGIADLAGLYKVTEGKGEGLGYEEHAEFAVPGHRFGLTHLVPALATAAPMENLASIKAWQDLGLNWANAVGALNELDGNVEYEQIDCVGLDVSRSRLVATFTVKRPYGYSGGLCSAGSTEYVAFWGDFGASECELTYLGTAKVRVHDIAGIPADGLSYAAVLPIDLTAFEQPCQQPVIGRIRAVLSWNTPPSTVNPNLLPYWGNRLDTHVQLPVLSPGSGTGPNIFAVGGIGVASLDSTAGSGWLPTSGSGLTKPNAHFFKDGTAVDSRPSPFGGWVMVRGNQVPLGSYRVQVRNLTAGSGWTTLVNPVPVGNSFGVLSTNTPTGEYYPYLDHDANEDQNLAYWYSTGDDLWEIKLDAKDNGGNALGEVSYRIQLDNTAPKVDIHIDNGGDCKKFTADNPAGIDGHFVAYDPNDHFGYYSLFILPDNLPGGVGTLTPSTGIVPTPTPGGTGWHLATAGMSTCAYVACVEAWDRTIVNSTVVGWGSGITAVGFSLD